MSQKFYDVVEFLIKNEFEIKKAVRGQAQDIIHQKNQVSRPFKTLYEDYLPKMIFKLIKNEISDKLNLNYEETEIIFDYETLAEKVPNFHERFLDERNFTRPQRIIKD